MTASTDAGAIPGYVAGTWEIDPVHSEVGFTARHMMVSKVRGRFTVFSGELVTGEKLLDSSVTATIEGQMNVLGILGADPDVRNGFEAITVRFAIDADASREDLQALIAQAQKRSAVFDVVANPTKVLVEVA